MILIVRLAVAQDRVARELDAELGPTHAVLHQLGMAVHEGRVQPRLLALGEGGLLVEVGDLEIRIGAQQELGVLTLLLLELGVALHGDDDLELAARHALEFAFELIRVAPEHLHDLGVLDAIE